MAKKIRKSATCGTTFEGIVRCGRENQAVVYDDFAGFPLVVTFLGGRWWITTPGEPLVPLEEYFGGEDIEFTFLCEAGGKVGALALAKLLGKAIEEPEREVCEVMANRVKILKRLGITLDVTDESLQLELRTFSNEGTYRRQGKFSALCESVGDSYESLFDIGDFESMKDAEEWANYYFEFLGNIGIDFIVTTNHD